MDMDVFGTMQRLLSSGNGMLALWKMLAFAISKHANKANKETFHCLQCYEEQQKLKTPMLIPISDFLSDLQTSSPTVCSAKATCFLSPHPTVHSTFHIY